MGGIWVEGGILLVGFGKWLVCFECAQLKLTGSEAHFIHVIGNCNGYLVSV